MGSSTLKSKITDANKARGAYETTSERDRVGDLTKKMAIDRRVGGFHGKKQTYGNKQTSTSESCKLTSIWAQCALEASLHVNYSRSV